MTDLDDFKHRIRTKWAQLDHAIIVASVHQWRRRLSVFVNAVGGHSEHCFFDFDNCFCRHNCDLFAVVIDRSNSCTPTCRFGLVSVMILCFTTHGDCLIRNVAVAVVL